MTRGRPLRHHHHRVRRTPSARHHGTTKLHPTPRAPLVTTSDVIDWHLRGSNIWDTAKTPPMPLASPHAYAPLSSEELCACYALGSDILGASDAATEGASALAGSEILGAAGVSLTG